MVDKSVQLEIVTLLHGHYSLVRATKKVHSAEESLGNDEQASTDEKPRSSSAQTLLDSDISGKTE